MLQEQTQTRQTPGKLFHPPTPPTPIQTGISFTASPWQLQPRDEERGANSGKYDDAGR